MSQALTLTNTLRPAPMKAEGRPALTPDLLITGQLGNLDAYIQAVNRIPLLTPEEERRYATELRDDNNLDSARHLVLSHLRLVV